mmetsp:Transcript_27826/g.83106  ORF Transcript_27826/g.83106 Transcript_27826/m.83106 type:complete len:212 (+) Transcript_27826:793-1428(+)
MQAGLDADDVCDRRGGSDKAHAVETHFPAFGPTWLFVLVHLGVVHQVEVEDRVQKTSKNEPQHALHGQGPQHLDHERLVLRNFHLLKRRGQVGVLPAHVGGPLGVHTFVAFERCEGGVSHDAQVLLDLVQGEPDEHEQGVGLVEGSHSEQRHVAVHDIVLLLGPRVHGHPRCGVTCKKAPKLDHCGQGHEGEHRGESNDLHRAVPLRGAAE